MSHFDMTIEKNSSDNKIGIIHFSGEIDSSCIGRIASIAEDITRMDVVYMVADMHLVTVISSAALGELIGCRTLLVEKGGDLVLSGLSLKLRERLTAMDANKIFRFFGDERSAVNAFRWTYHKKSEELKLMFPSRLNFVPPVRQLVSRIARHKGFSSRDAFRIETIVDEVCNNAVEHGAKDKDVNVDLNVSVNLDKIEIRVVNASDPEKVKSLKEIAKTLAMPKPGDEQKRGRGLTLIKMLSNNLNIDCSEVGTQVHVTKIREE